MQGKKTHEQQVGIFEERQIWPDARKTEAEIKRAGRDGILKRNIRQTEFPISLGFFIRKIAITTSTMIQDRRTIHKPQTRRIV